MLSGSSEMAHALPTFARLSCLRNSPLVEEVATFSPFLPVATPPHGNTREHNITSFSQCACLWRCLLRDHHLPKEPACLIELLQRSIALASEMLGKRATVYVFIYVFAVVVVVIALIRIIWETMVTPWTIHPYVFFATLLGPPLDTSRPLRPDFV